MNLVEYGKMEAIENNHFWFFAKRKFLQMILDKYAPVKELRILDVGCGTGAILAFLRCRGRVVEGVDSSETALQYCRAKGLNVTNGSVEKMNYPDGYFDVVLASDVLEHITDDRAAMKEIYRVLKGGGFLIATVPAHKFLWSYHDVALHHQRRYSRDDWTELLSRNFQIHLITWLHAVILLPVWLMRKLEKISKKKVSESDVKPVNGLVNQLMKVCYWPELIFFKVFRRLPFGLSLLGVAQKQNQI